MRLVKFFQGGFLVMSDCGNGCSDGRGGPFSEGRELVEFVLQANGGGVAKAPIPNGGLNAKGQGCGAEVVLKNFFGVCPKGGGGHAGSPPRGDGPGNIQFGGKNFPI